MNTHIPASQLTHDPVDKYKQCPKCFTELPNLILGGVGDWKHTVMCSKCFFVQENVDLVGVILPLLALQKHLEVFEVAELQELAEKEYLEAVLENAIEL